MVGWTVVRRRCAAIVTLIAAAAVVSVPAAADPVSDAKSRVERLLERVHALQHRVDGAERAYQHRLDGVAHAVTVASLADRITGAAAQDATAAHDRLVSRVSALYMSGGPISLFASTLAAGSVGDFQSRTYLVQRIVAADRTAVVTSQRRLVDARRREAAAVDREHAQIATARDVAQALVRVNRLLARQAAVLDRARQAETQAESVAAAARALSQEQAAAVAITSAGISSLQVLPPSPDYLALYHHAAATCPGLSWTVLAAIGQVESGHGRNPSTSSAGAMGPMQFLPSTFTSYAVDGDGDGAADIMNPADAIFTAARYLCANGAGAGPSALSAAVWHYNHADWYVRMVLTLAREYAGG